MTHHLIHIGFPKTGSNFLRRWFAAHPDIEYVEGGIAGFQSVYAMVRRSAAGQPLPPWRVTSAEGFATPHGSFGLARVDHAKILQTPMLVAQTSACILLHSLFPDATVVIVTRAIRGAVFSAYSQYVREGGHLDLNGFCDGPDRGAAWNYDAIIAQYRARFGSSKIIVLPYELLRDDPQEFFRNVAIRLGLRNIVLPQGRSNPALSGIELAWYTRIARVFRCEVFPVTVGRWLAIVRARLAADNYLRRLIGWLQYWRPMKSITIDDLTDEMLAGWTYTVRSLEVDPVYRAYGIEYGFKFATEGGGLSRSCTSK